MTQGALLNGPGSGLAVRTHINNAIMRLASGASGVARPDDIATFECWIDTSSPGSGVATLWQWDGGADVLLGFVNTTTHAFTSAATATDKGDLVKRGASGDVRLGVGVPFSNLQIVGAGDDIAYAPTGYVKIAPDVLPNGDASVAFASIPAIAKHVMIVFKLRPATNLVTLTCRVARAGVLDTTANYDAVGEIAGNAGASNMNALAATSWLLPWGATSTVKNTTPDGGVCGRILLPDIQSTRYPRIVWDTAHDDAGLFSRCFCNGRNTLAGGPVDGVTLAFSSGNIAEGRVSIFATLE